jgi:hypothetical protein
MGGNQISQRVPRTLLHSPPRQESICGKVTTCPFMTNNTPDDMGWVFLMVLGLLPSIMTCLAWCPNPPHHAPQVLSLDMCIVEHGGRPQRCKSQNKCVPCIILVVLVCIRCAENMLLGRVGRGSTRVHTHTCAHTYTHMLFWIIAWMQPALGVRLATDGSLSFPCAGWHSLSPRSSGTCLLLLSRVGMYAARAGPGLCMSTHQHTYIT